MRLFEFSGFIYLALPAQLFVMYVLRIFLFRRYFLDLTSIFLVSFFIFFSGKIVGFALLGLDHFFSRSIVNVTLPYSLMDKISFLGIISISLILLTEVGLWKRRGNSGRSQMGTDFRWFSLGRILLLISFPIMLLRMITEFNYIRGVGYLAVYAEGLKGIEYPFPSSLVLISYYTFISGYFLIVAAKPAYRQFFLYSAIFLLVSFFDSLKGGRANIAIPFLFIIWWSYFGYLKKISFTVASIFAVTIGIFFGWLGSARLGDSVDIGSAGLSFLASQGNSPVVMAFRELYDSEFSQFSQFSVFSNLLIPFYYIFYPGLFDMPQSEEIVNIAGGLKHVLTYVVDRQYYLSGGGLGSTYLAELYEFGLLGVVLGSILVGYSFRLFDRMLFNRALCFFSYFLFSHIFLLPRAEFFPNLWALMKIYFLLIIWTKVVLHKNFLRFFSNRVIRG